MHEQEIHIGKIYKHFKGGFILVLSLDKAAEGGYRVSYLGLNDGKTYSRLLDAPDGFFSKTKNAEGVEVYRFTLATQEESDSLLPQSVLHEVASFIPYINSCVEENKKNKNFLKKL